MQLVYKCIQWVVKGLIDKCQLAISLTAHNEYTSAVYYECTSESLTNVGLLLNWLHTMSIQVLYTMSVQVNPWQMSACSSIDCVQWVYKCIHRVFKCVLRFIQWE